MVETLTNLKNNKSKRSATSSAGDEVIERLRKFLASLSKRRHSPSSIYSLLHKFIILLVVLAHEPLRVTLTDLHSAESKGKWWLVGAAWGGDPLVEHAENRQEAQDEAESGSIENNTFLKLAKKQGMNTEIRRGIFVVLMSSDACILSYSILLAVSELSMYRTMWMLVRGCLSSSLRTFNSEKSYGSYSIAVETYVPSSWPASKFVSLLSFQEKLFNPYYTLVGQQLCRTSHSHKVTLQFCLWDFLRDLGETNVGGTELIKNLGEDGGFDVKNISSTRLRNVARAYGWWIAKNCCTLAIFKVHSSFSVISVP